MSKQPPPAPTASTIGPCPTVIQISRTPWHWKFTKHLRATRPPPVSEGFPSFSNTGHLHKRVKYTKEKIWGLRPFQEYRLSSLSRLRLSRRENLILVLTRNLTSGQKIVDQRIYLTKITCSFVKFDCSIQFCNSDMSKYGYFEVFQRVPTTSR